MRSVSARWHVSAARWTRCGNKSASRATCRRSSTTSRTTRSSISRRRGSLLRDYRELKKRIDAALPQAFSVFPKADYEIREVEAFRAESAAGAYYQPPSADGSRPGIFYVNTFNLKALPKFGTETLSLHEASPGHHFQVSIKQELEGVPKFRRFGGDYTAYVEGWALYAESLGKELGLFTDPYQWFGRLNDEMLRAMRLVVDTGLHAKGWSREQAIRFMLDNSTLAEVGRDVSEVERYIAVAGAGAGLQGRRPADPGPATQCGATTRREVRPEGLPSRSIVRWRRAARRAREEDRSLDRGATLIHARRNRMRASDVPAVALAALVMAGCNSPTRPQDARQDARRRRNAAAAAATLEQAPRSQAERRCADGCRRSSRITSTSTSR